MEKKRKNSRAKGAVGERELAKELNRLFGTTARRGQQYSGIEGEDVVGLTGIHVESKRVENLNVNKAMEQAIRDATNQKVPAVFHRRNHKPWLVTLRLDDVEAFVTAMQLVLSERVVVVETVPESAEPVVESIESMVVLKPTPARKRTRPAGRSAV